MLWTSKFGSKRAIFSATGLRSADELRGFINAFKPLLETGVIKTVIDKTYALEDVAQAHAYIDSGRKKGNVVAVLM